MLIGNAVVGQSGGPTAAINATLAGVIAGATSTPYIQTLYGMHNGLEGLLKENIVNLSEKQLTEEQLALLSATPAAALGSCRKKLPAINQRSIYLSILSIFKKYNIRYFFYIGGNDSMDAVYKLDAFMKDEDYDVRIIGIPKTIDNDLMYTHHTPGYGSAAKYVAVTMQEIIRDTAVYTTPAVTIVEIMGRDAGWLTAAAALPRLNGVGPDFIYLPEVTFETEKVLMDVACALTRHPNVVIALSEGVKTPTGAYLSESDSVDAFGHKALSGAGKALESAIKQHMHCKTRVIELNTPQRCAAHCASLTDIQEAKAIGTAAVHTAVQGASGVMMTLGDTIGTVPAVQIANQVRTVPSTFIHPSGNDITTECMNYMIPLIQGEVEITWKYGLPQHFTL